MYVHLKQSGESLSGQGETGLPWEHAAVNASADNISAAYHDRAELDVQGLMIVSGAGNLVRGAYLREHGLADGKADLLGRLAIIQNTIVLAEALKERDVEVAQFIANTMAIKDIAIQPDEFLPYTPDRVKEAYADGKLVLVAGGTGHDHMTTDNAVLEYARRHRVAFPTDSVTVLKGTKFNGVYDSDPAKPDNNAQRFGTISAGVMQAEYERFAVVDEASLETIQETGLTLRVYADADYSLESMLRNPDRAGTLIVPGDSEPIYADEAASLLYTRA